MYVLECVDKTLYTGYTTDLKKRLATHNAGKGAKYTRYRLPVSLLYYEVFDSKEAAMSAEALFKKRKTRSQKLAYIATHQKKRKIIETYHLNDFFMLHCLPQAPIL
ncbi:GIY-YIG nuclease family protein [Streptococcus pyogenes]|nr:GIY-YIG nuclease family protein [Streptococcus pyogenes]